jgi:hypothetical protein
MLNPLKQKHRKYAQKKRGWKMPEAPICTECGNRAIPSVYHTGDGWVAGWECLATVKCNGPDDFTWNDGDDGLGPVIRWPFVDDYVWDYDWQRLGFQLV